MGSLATSEMIFFIVTLVVSASVVGVLGGQATHITDSISQSGKSVSQTIDTSFQIINDPSQIPYNHGYVFYIKNTGSQTFDFTNATVSTIVNGTMLSGPEVSYISPGNSAQLTPGQVGDIIVQVGLSAGSYSLKVSLSNGISQNMEFQIQ